MSEKKSNLTVLRGVLKNSVLAAFFDYSVNGYDDLKAEFLSRLYTAGGEENFLAFAEKVILLDENAFSVACATGKQPSAFVEKAFAEDLAQIINAILNTYPQNSYCVGGHIEPFCNDTARCLTRLKEFYARFGYGIFIENAAFTYDGEKLTPVTCPKITLEDLKNYEPEKKLVESNISSFLRGLPYSHMLLYGDMGTGKSSTIHAMLNKYFSSGLRIIEINKENVLQIPSAKQLVLGNPLKFIFFIDDLSLEESDGKVSAFKAILEGSVASNAENVMIVATSNRRHIIKESFSERENSVHASDSVQEQLSLSDRFGLTVMFSTTDKQDYLSIVGQLAADKGLNMPRAELEAVAERFAIVKGGRSPRRARQFVDIVYASQIKGDPVIF